MLLGMIMREKPAKKKLNNILLLQNGETENKRGWYNLRQTRKVVPIVSCLYLYLNIFGRILFYSNASLTNNNASYSLHSSARRTWKSKTEIGRIKNSFSRHLEPCLGHIYIFTCMYI